MSSTDAKIVEAHYQTVNLSFKVYYPSHELRTTDPHYKLFNAARKRIVSSPNFAGCWVCGSKENIQIHHSLVEFAAANAIDLDRFEHLWPELHITDENSLLAALESEGNMMALCEDHHISREHGIHFIPYPTWVLQRYWQKGLPEPVKGVKNQTIGETQP